MTNKELMQSLAYVKGLLYRCPFSGDQMMVAAECVRVLDASLAQLNELVPDNVVGSAPSEEQKTAE